MAEKVKLHPVTPHQKRILILPMTFEAETSCCFPTDTQYALACSYTSKKGIERIRHDPPAQTGPSSDPDL
jgi:tRNA A37 threonylcarbamoyladenosine synthetase subunit TsaC/SUA5/YrdC